VCCVGFFDCGINVPSFKISDVLRVVVVDAMHSFRFYENETVDFVSYFARNAQEGRSLVVCLVYIVAVLNSGGLWRSGNVHVLRMLELEW